MADEDEPDEWRPPKKIEDLYSGSSSGGPPIFALNAPTAGARNDDPVEKGEASFQLYSLATPNGQKIGILLEELGIDYDAHTINIGMGLQFSKGFVDINPNSKIPCGVDWSPADGKGPIRLFESGSMMLYLCDKLNRFIPADARARAECINWVMWQVRVVDREWPERQTAFGGSAVSRLIPFDALRTILPNVCLACRFHLRFSLSRASTSSHHGPLPRSILHTAGK